MGCLDEGNYRNFGYGILIAAFLSVLTEGASLIYYLIYEGYIILEFPPTLILVGGGSVALLMAQKNSFAPQIPQDVMIYISLVVLIIVSGAFQIYYAVSLADGFVVLGLDELDIFYVITSMLLIIFHIVIVIFSVLVLIMTRKIFNTSGKGNMFPNTPTQVSSHQNGWNQPQGLMQQSSQPWGQQGLQGANNWDQPSNSGPNWGQSSNSGQNRSGPPNSGPNWGQPSNSGQNRSGPPNSGPNWGQPSNSGPNWGQPSNSGQNRSGPPNSGPNWGQPSNSGQNRSGPPNSGPNWGQSSNSGPSWDQSGQQNPSRFQDRGAPATEQFQQVPGNRNFSSNESHGFPAPQGDGNGFSPASKAKILPPLPQRKKTPFSSSGYNNSGGNGFQQQGGYSPQPNYQQGGQSFPQHGGNNTYQPYRGN